MVTLGRILVEGRASGGDGNCGWEQVRWRKADIGGGSSVTHFGKLSTGKLRTPLPYGAGRTGLTEIGGKVKSKKVKTKVQSCKFYRQKCGEMG